MAKGNCPCGSKKLFGECCEPFLEYRAAAPTSLDLMRSRYTAFCRQNVDYLARTHDPETRDAFDRAEAQAWSARARFTGLEILKHSEEGDRGWVEFKASFREDGHHYVHHEFSEFRRLDGRWYFRQGRDQEEHN